MELPKGPWKEIFSMNAQGYPVKILQNDEYDVLVIIEDKEGGGYVVMGYRPLLASGNIEPFVEALKRRVIGIVRKRKDLKKFIVLETEPVYSKNLENDVMRIMNRIDEDFGVVSRMAGAYDIKVTRLDRESAGDFFSEVIVTPLLILGEKEKKKEVVGREKRFVLLGERMGEKVEVVIEDFSFTVLSGGEEVDRLLVAQVLAENAVLSGYPVVVFRWDGEMDGISVPNPEPGDLEPSGFPTQRFSPGKDFVVDLNLVDPEAFLEFLGVGEGKYSEIIKGVLERSGEIEDLKDLMKRVEKVETEYRFHKYRALRVLKLAEKYYKDLFGRLNMDDFMSGWLQGMGKVSLVTLLPDRSASLLLIHSFLSGISKYFKGEDIKAFIMILKADRVFPPVSSPLLDSVRKGVAEARKRGVGVILEAEQEVLLHPDVQKLVETRISVVKGRDVGVKSLARKPYRVVIRKTLSEFRPPLPP